MDYRKLHLTSSVDLLRDVYTNYRPRKRSRRSRVFEVERLIAKRDRAEGTEYLVKWLHYSKYEATWESADDISPECIRLFEHPQPDRVEVIQALDQLRQAVECRLKSKSCLPLTIDFPSHVFRYLFEGKGEVNGGWLYLNQEDFRQEHFPKDWDRYLDHFGEGHKICYPLRMRHFLSWSPKKFIYDANGVLQESPRAYTERVSFSFARTPC